MIIDRDISKDWKKYSRREGHPPTRREVEIDQLVVHCTADDDLQGEDVWSIIKYHTHSNHVCKGEAGCWTICYHYYIEKSQEDTVVWKTVPHDIVTFHAGYWNKRSLGIVLDKKERDMVSGEKYEALVELLAKLCIQYTLHPMIAIVGHRNLYWTGWRMDEKKGIILRNKTCPGELNPNINQLKLDVRDRLYAEKYELPHFLPSGYYLDNEVYHTNESYERLVKYNRIRKLKGMRSFLNIGRLARED